MNLDHLRVLVAVLENGTFTAAAARLKLSQPAVSQHMAALEREAGIPLFERAGRRRVPTEAAHMLAERGRAALAALEEADQTAEELRGLRRGRLLVGASPTPGAYLVPGLLGSFTEQHPDVQVRIEIAGASEIDARLLAREVDLAIVGEHDRPEGVEATRLATDDLIPIWSRSANVSGKRRISLEQFLDEPFIAPPPRSGTRQAIDRWLGERSIRLRPAMELESAEAIKRAVASGLGVAIVSENASRLEVQQKLLQTGRVAGFPIRRRIEIEVLRGRRPTMAAWGFLSMLLGKGRAANLLDAADSERPGA
ncbi:MAG TPA: LysR family transcriptional regulator [Actinomycetota bacterium]